MVSIGMKPYAELSDIEITWENGQHNKLAHLERPQVYIEDGEPLLLLRRTRWRGFNATRLMFRYH